MQQGYIKLYRKITHNAIFNDFQLYRLWSLCLLNASYKEREILIDGQLVEIKPGQWIIGRFTLFDTYNNGLSPKDKVKSEKTPYRWLEKLEKLGYLILEKTNKYTVVNVVNWDFYQGDDTENDHQIDHPMTIKRPSKDHQMTTNKKVKKDKNEKKSIYVEIIDFLNLQAGTNYKHSTKKTKDLINARLNEGFKLDDFKSVIKYCCSEWKGKTFSNGKKGDEYLQPSTLFNNKFDERLNKAKMNSVASVEQSKPSNYVNGISENDLLNMGE